MHHLSENVRIYKYTTVGQTRLVDHMLLGAKLVIIGFQVFHMRGYHQRYKILQLHLCSFKWFQNKINWGVKFKVVVGLVTKKKKNEAMMTTHSLPFLGFRKIIQAPFHFILTVINFTWIDHTPFVRFTAIFFHSQSFQLNSNVGYVKFIIFFPIVFLWKLLFIKLCELVQIWNFFKS